MGLRDYQESLVANVYAAWAFGHRYVCAVAPCGAGKTVMMSEIFRRGYEEPQLAIAHRQELVGQISMALGRAGLYHRIIAPPAVEAFCSKQQAEALGQSYVNKGAPLAVCGIDTLIRRKDDAEMARWLARVKRWALDEGHHLLVTNKWGTGVASMPNARGTGWTATPGRADRKSLKLGQGGYYETMVMGPAPRSLIQRGFLAPYRIIAPRCNIDLARVEISKTTGDYNPNQLREAAHRSTIVGDVVKTYQRFGAGMKGVVFAVDVQMAEDHSGAFNDAGIECAVITDRTPDDQRANINRAMATGRLMMVSNVDVLGEGYDCPGIWYAALARPTASLPLAIQQMMRPMRPAPGKTAVIADHVGNIYGKNGHGLPDAPRRWSLDDGHEPEEREIPMRHCLNLSCLNVWEGWGRMCPDCGWVPPVRSRDGASIEMVEGDLIEVDPAFLERTYAEAERLVDVNQQAQHSMGGRRQRDQQIGRAQEHLELKDAMAMWRGVRELNGESDAVSYMLFYRRFGIDVASAQTLLDRAKIRKLTEEVRADYEQ